jgi:cell division protein FtsW
MFFARQIIYLAAATAVMVAISMLNVRGVRMLAWLGLGGSVLMVAATLVTGVEIKGARRWLSVPGLGSVQPSEFLKPCFAIVAAWLIAEGKVNRRHGATLLAILLFLGIAVLLKGQPDVGMLMVVTSVFFAQFFVAGLNLFLVGAVGAMGVAAAVGAYLIFPHVQSRVARFLDPNAGDNYQVTVALEAFGHGGLLGRGPGEGRVKNVLPDAHADFVFAVAGEEFGLVMCLVILALFGFVVVRGLIRLLGETDLFIVLAAAGLLTQFGLQAFVNMASSLHLIPTKGMTLPFVSYGGSSVLAIALGMGFLLALTRRRLSRAEEDR